MKKRMYKMYDGSTPWYCEVCGGSFAKKHSIVSCLKGIRRSIDWLRTEVRHLKDHMKDHEGRVHGNTK